MPRRIFPALVLALSLAACSSFLDQQPIDQLPVDQAITDAAGARAALGGAYRALQLTGYYYDDFYIFGDLSSDNAVNVGTFNEYLEADNNTLRADNLSVYNIWQAIYVAISRVNIILAKVPGVPGLSTTARNQILGEAHFLRALHYHNLVKLFGGVPLKLAPPTSITDPVARATKDEVYAQIESDLTQAEALMTRTSPTIQATPGAAKALLARVYLYENKLAEANAKADEVIALGYQLTPTYGDLFDAEGQNTTEDIFKVEFTAQNYQLMYYWISSDEGGGNEVAPSQSLIDAYPAGDVRKAWNILGTTSPAASGYKYQTTAGAEDLHVIRFAEVLLIKAEVLARQNDLAGAVDEYNKIRVRANLAPHVLGVEVTTQQQVLDEIDLQRRLELFAEGDRWPDLVRSGRWADVLPGVPAFQTLYPIPLTEIDVAPGLVQNPGY